MPGVWGKNMNKNEYICSEILYINIFFSIFV